MVEKGCSISVTAATYLQKTNKNVKIVYSDIKQSHYFNGMGYVIRN